MNKVDLFIADLIRSYPMLNKNRDRVLDHIFCVIGNGYEWAPNGCPSNIFEDLEEDETREQIISNWEYEDLTPIYDNANELAKRVSLDPQIDYWYSICEYSMIDKLPENIDPDWLEAAVETMIKVSRTPKFYQPGHPDEPYHIRDWENNISYANRFLENLYPEIQAKLLKEEKGE